MANLGKQQLQDFFDVFGITHKAATSQGQIKDVPEVDHRLSNGYGMITTQKVLDNAVRGDSGNCLMALASVGALFPAIMWPAVFLVQIPGDDTIWRMRPTSDSREKALAFDRDGTLPPLGYEFRANPPTGSDTVKAKRATARKNRIEKRVHFALYGTPRPVDPIRSAIAKASNRRKDNRRMINGR